MPCEDFVAVGNRMKLLHHYASIDARKFQSLILSDAKAQIYSVNAYQFVTKSKLRNY